MELLNIFTEISDWAKGGSVVAIVGVVVTILRKKGIPLKFWLKRGSVITKEVGEFFMAVSNTFDTADKAIKSDNKLIENNVKDVIAAGKQARLEFKDVIMTIKPKKKK
jgi:hypothetical protein